MFVARWLMEDRTVSRMQCLSKLQPDAPPQENFLGSVSQLACVLPSDRYKLSDTSGNKQVTITERSSAPPSERIRAVAMCFYGRGNDLKTSFLYKLKRNPQNPKDDSYIELTGNGHVKAIMKAHLSKLMAPLIDNGIIRVPKWYVYGLDKMDHSPWIPETARVVQEYWCNFF